MKKEVEKSKLKSAIEIGAIVIALIGLITTFILSNRANEIEEIAVRPHIISIDSYRLKPSWDEFDGKMRITCLSRIRVSNTGGNNTTLISITANILLGSDKIKVDFNDVSAGGDLIEGILYTSSLASGTSGVPETFPAHTTSDIDLRLEVEVTKKVYILESSDFTQPKNPSLLEGPDRELWIEYILHFPDADSVTAPPVYCTYVKNAIP